MNQENASSKIFVGGLGTYTTRESMKKYFGTFGEVEDCMVIRDRHTGKSRGFGFVIMKDAAVASEIINKKKHILDGIKVDCREATKKAVDPETKALLEVRNKIFVGGLHQGVTEEHLHEHFGRYGAIVDCQILKDRENGRSRGFAFIVFDTEQTMEKVLANAKEHVILGKWVECKRAMPKPARFSPFSIDV